jgi:hypothetical protein
LPLDRAHDTFVAVPDIDAHQLAVEVDEALPFRCPEVDAFGARDRDWIDRRLHGPLVDRMTAREFNYLRAAQGVNFGSHGRRCYSNPE